MAGLGIGPTDFELFAIEDPEQRADALERTIQPKLQTLAEKLVGGLSRVAGKDLHAHAPAVLRRKNEPPEQVLVAFCEDPRGLRGLPYLAVAVTRAQLHARVAVRGESKRTCAIQGALGREAGNLSRRGKPFRNIRDFTHWDFGELPEPAPAHSPAFWKELADGLTRSGNRGPALELGVVWPEEDARSISLGDVLGVFRDMAPIYKLLANAR